MDSSLVGQEFDSKFLIRKVLGEGGLGVVYKAEQIDLSRFVAIKVLHEAVLDTENSNARFEREAKVLSTLQHPHIVSLYSFGNDGQHAYIAMEYLEGITLAQLIAQEQKPDWKRILKIIVQICDALGYAHKNGIVHRDLKPQNIILLDKPEADYVKVLDFGLSKLTTDTSNQIQKLTQTGAVLGSVQYMAPESCLGQSVEARSDIYSLGCILYECLAGYAPLSADNPLALLHKHVNEVPKPLPPTTPKALASITFKALEKQVTNRFQSMDDFAAALSLVLDGREDELKIQVSKSQNKFAHAKTIVFFSTLLFICLIAVTAYLTNRKTTNASLFNSMPSSTETARRTQINKAKILVIEAHKFYAEHNTSQATLCARKALNLILRKYNSNSLNKEFATEDLAILEGLMPIISSTKSKGYFNSKEISTAFKTNNQDFLSTAQTIELSVCFSDLYELSGNYASAISDLYLSLKYCIDLKKSAQAKDLLLKLRNRIVESDEQKLIKDTYIEIASARIQLLDGQRDLATKTANKAFSAITNNEIIGAYDKSKLLIELSYFFDKTNDIPGLINLLDAAKPLAADLVSTHPDQIYEVQRHLMITYFSTGKYSKAETELHYLDKCLDSIQKTDYTQSKKAFVADYLNRIKKQKSLDKNR